jgi:hypothetical protein
MTFALSLAACNNASSGDAPLRPTIDSGTTEASSAADTMGQIAPVTSAQTPIACALDQAQRNVECTFHNSSEFSDFEWTSNATSRTSGGPTFEFGIENEEAQIEVMVTVCAKGSCQEFTSVADNDQGRSPESNSVVDSTKLLGRNFLGLDFSAFPFSCAELNNEEFTSTFFPTDLITAIQPMGTMAPMMDHVTPTDHFYIFREYSAGDEYVLAPADGFIVELGRFSEDVPMNGADEQGVWLGDNAKPQVPDIRAVIMHSCTLFTIFIHVGELAPAVSEAVGDIKKGGYWNAGPRNAPVPVKAGEPIAKYGSQNLDWSVHDANTVLEGFIVPARYEFEPFKIHTVDPFQYYREPARAELLAKVLRQVEPRSGKIDYDIEGRIVGNWFLEGTTDYMNARAQLTIAYGYIDPSQLRISIGADTGIDETLCGACVGAYGVRGNAPDPATVNTDTGLVKYELMDRIEESRLVREAVGTTSLGTFLVQHLGNRRIRVEVFPGEIPEGITGFSDASQIYQR